MNEPAASCILGQAELTAAIKKDAEKLGFELCGIAPAVSPTGFDFLKDWLQKGYAGEMEYISRREGAYETPGGVLDGVRSVVMLGMNYRTAGRQTSNADDGLVARYAWGSADYHDLIRKRLKQFAKRLHEQRPGCKTRSVVDTAPLLERDFAKLAGLGWFGKNTMLINKQAGSWLFLAALLTDIELEFDEPHHTSHCGTCRRCLDVCPTDAFPEPYVLDARRCISYLTIELRDRPIPSEMREGMGEWLFGCDLCQDVCPWNNKSPVSTEPAFQPDERLNPADAVTLLQLNEAAFRERFRKSPLARPGRAGLLRNAAIVLGNSRSRKSVAVLANAVHDTEPLVRGASAWALGQLGGEEARVALESRLEMEKDATVLDELQAALERVQR